MALRFVETLDSRTVDSNDGQASAVRRWHVYNDASGGGTAISSPEDVIALYGTVDAYGAALPAKGDPFPGLPSLVAMSPRIARVPGHSDVWSVEWQYRAVNFVPTDLEPLDVGYVEVTTSAYGEPMDVWRSLTAAQFDALVSSGGAYAFGNATGETDIGGQKVDVGGTQTSVTTFKVEIQLGETVDTLPDHGYLLQFLNRRNNTTFSGAPIGSVVYRGFDTARLDAGRWRVSHRFVLDKYYHLVQVAWRNPDGNVWIGSDGYAARVAFRQPFQGGADFSAISPAIAGVI